MNIWPWSRIKELEAEKDKWMTFYLDIYKSRRKVLQYLDSVEPGWHVCLQDKLYLFKPEPESEWVEIGVEETK